VRLHVDGPRVHEVLAALGLDANAVPPEPAVVEVRTWDAVTMRYTAAGREVVYSAMPSPEVVLPSGWDPAALGRLYLTLLGVAPQEAEALAASIDWTSTLVLPVPVGEAEAAPVRVDGVDGVLFASSWEGRSATARREHAYRGGEPAAAGGVTVRPEPAVDLDTDGQLLLWQKDGVLYALAGSVGADELVALAGDLR
jgi:hypothetical protein